MKRFALPTFALTVGLVFAPPLSAADRTVTILHLSDTHSHLDATGTRDRSLDGTVGGIAKATTVISEARAQDPDALLLHGGDILQGDLFFNSYFGVPELQWMVAMRFDAMAVGNHEFDPGPEMLAGILAQGFAEGSVPLLSANAGNLGSLEAFVRGSILKTAGGVKVGIFGLTVPDDPMCQNPPVTLDPNVADVASAEVARLRTAGAEVVVLLSHLGLAADTTVAEAVNGIDVILGAHDHYLLDEPVEVSSPSGRPVLIFQSGPHFANVGRLRLKVRSGRVQLVDYDLLAVDRHVRPDPAVAALVSQMKAGVEASFGPVFSTEIGVARRDLPILPRERSPWKDTPTGNLVTDAFRAAGRTDLAFTTTGFLSEGISRGPLVAADLFRVVSYGFDEETGLGFRLVTSELGAEALATVLEIGVAGPGPGDAFFPHVSGIRFAYNSRQPAGARVSLESIRIGGEPLDPTRTYTLTTNAAVAMFLVDMLGVPLSNVTPLPDAFEYTALLAAVEGMGGVVDPRADGRVRDLVPACGPAATKAPISNPAR
ncbi:MAG: 5'-nucleotidase C-terminal domain-containing protein [Holophagales bacterium]|nr:5'-nucleotidase C-terminal domain-containing protein [Holophagales bacterium]MBK9965607.1 5'-nucleotidase C-terminal domain-containing protein [Holophagales bacterium]